MNFVNRTLVCRQHNANNKKVLPTAAVTHIVIHRTDLCVFDPVANPHPVPNALLDGPALAERFCNVALGCGGCIPYHFLIRVNAPTWTVEQLLPLSIRGAHAIGYNYRSWGIAVLGDFRRAAPPVGQYDALVQLVALLLPAVRPDGLIVAGHTDLPGAAANSKKVCPGSFLPAAKVRADAVATLPPGWTTWTPETLATRWLDVRLAT